MALKSPFGSQETLVGLLDMEEPATTLTPEPQTAKEKIKQGAKTCGTVAGKIVLGATMILFTIVFGLAATPFIMVYEVGEHLYHFGDQCVNTLEEDNNTEETGSQEVVSINEPNKPKYPLVC